MDKIFDGFILVSDMDGTLVGSNREVSKKNRDAIKYFTERGGKFTVATGRMVQSVEEFVSDLHIKCPTMLHNGAKIYDDYAHHPTEIKATLESALKVKHNKLWVVFQPHTYSRTKALFNEFVTAFDNADTLILTDIYAAREKDDGTVSSKMLADEINKKKKNCLYIATIEEVADYLKNNVQKNDIILTIGAGTVTKIGYMIKE